MNNIAVGLSLIEDLSKIIEAFSPLLHTAELCQHLKVPGFNVGAQRKAIEQISFPARGDG